MWKVYNPELRFAVSPEGKTFANGDNDVGMKLAGVLFDRKEDAEARLESLLVPGFSVVEVLFTPVREHSVDMYYKALLLEVLKESLTVKVSVDKEYGSYDGPDYVDVKVVLELDGIEISTASFNLPS